MCILSCISLVIHALYHIILILLKAIILKITDQYLDTILQTYAYLTIQFEIFID